MLSKELISVLHDTQIINHQYLDEPINALVNDTRQVMPGSCFIAIRGENFDGHGAIKEVAAKGARLIIVEEIPSIPEQYPAAIVKVPSTFRAQAILANKFYHEPSSQLKVVAVTGTNGKTTTSSMISQLLEALNHKTGLIGTIVYKVGKQYYPAINTTPNALELQKLFNEMVENNCTDAIIEASSHALALGRLWYTDIDCAIYTNLTREHLDFHHTMEGYAAAKSLLFSQLGQKFVEGKPRLAIINLDDPYADVMKQATAADIVSYSLTDENATAYAHSIIADGGETQFILSSDGASYRVELPMRGTYNVSNFLAAFLCLNKYYKIPAEEIIEAMSYFEGVSGRMQAINEGQPFEIIVDFAHTTDALERVLQELSNNKEPGQRLITLFGHSGGNRDSGARPDLGALLFKYSDEIIFTADNPRFESVAKIAQDMIGSHQEKPYKIIENRMEAVNHLISYAQAGDILLFAGKGGESYQVIGKDNIPYDEVQTIITALKEIENN